MVTGLPPLPAWMRSTGLPHAWRGRPAWRVLDTDFGDGTRLAQLWRTWADDPQACRLLHLVGFADRPPDPEPVLRALLEHGIDAQGRHDLQQQWFGLLPGLHRLVLHGGRLRLTLGVGPTLALLREQQFLADTIVVGAPSAHSGAAGGGARATGGRCGAGRAGRYGHPRRDPARHRGGAACGTRPRGGA